MAGRAQEASLGKPDHLRLFDKRAGERRHDELLSIRVGLGMVRIPDAGDVSRDLDERVLQARARSEKGPAALARPADGVDRAGRVLVGAPRDEP